MELKKLIATAIIATTFATTGFALSKPVACPSLSVMHAMHYQGNIENIWMFSAPNNSSFVMVANAISKQNAEAMLYQKITASNSLNAKSEGGLFLYCTYAPYSKSFPSPKQTAVVWVSKNASAFAIAQKFGSQQK